MLAIAHSGALAGAYRRRPLSCGIRAMQKKHLALAVLVTAVWGLNFPITKLGLAAIDPLLLTALRFTLFINDINIFAILIGQHRLIIDKRGVEFRAARQADAGKETRRELTLRVLQQRAHPDRAGARR